MQEVEHLRLDRDQVVAAAQFAPIAVQSKILEMIRQMLAPDRGNGDSEHSSRVADSKSKRSKGKIKRA
ncbi:hypothetical protein GCM10007880_62720 [Mesorhizobium amorphae]|nr:hypothetical protein GCM10007880_62720 [Mesorhizobium amorphae]